MAMDSCYTHVTPVSVVFVSVSSSQSTYCFILLTYFTLLRSTIILVWVWWWLFVALGLVVAMAVMVVVGGWTVGFAIDE